MDEQFKKAINGWPENTKGHQQEASAIETLTELGKNLGFGRLQQLTQEIEEFHICPDPERKQQIVNGRLELKKQMFHSLGWEFSA